MKKKMLLLASCLLLTGCGSNAVSQEEYDQVVAERDELKEENENMQKISDVYAKASECKAKIEAQYEHAVFTISIAEQVSGEDMGEVNDSLDSLYDLSIRSIDVVIDTNNSVDSYMEMSDETYDSAIQMIETIDDTWKSTYDSIIEIEEMFSDNN